MDVFECAPSHFKYRKVLFFTIAFVCLFLALIWGRAYYGAMKSFHEGEAFLEKGRDLEAVTSFDRSMHWFTPFSRYVEKSAKRLWEISTQAESDGDTRLALIAVRTLRRGFISARSFYTPGKTWIRRCDERIHNLTSISNTSILEHPQVKGPDVFWSLVLIFSFLGWTGCTIVFILCRSKKGQKKKRLDFGALKWVLLGGGLWITWIVAMMKA